MEQFNLGQAFFSYYKWTNYSKLQLPNRDKMKFPDESMPVLNRLTDRCFKQNWQC